MATSIGIEKIIQYGSKWATGSLMAANIKEAVEAGKITSIHMTQAGKAKAQRYDCKLYDIILGMYSMGRYEVALAKTPDGGYAEVRDNDTGVYQIARVTEKDKKLTFVASTCSLKDVKTEYELDKHKGTVLLAAFLAYRYAADPECKKFVDDMRDYLYEDPNDAIWNDAAFVEKFLIQLTSVNVNLYYTLVEYGANIFWDGILRDQVLKTLSPLVNDSLFGKLNKLKPEGGAPAINSKTGQYQIGTTPLTPEEALLVPKKKSGYVERPWEATVARDVQESMEFDEPMNVICLVGPSGTGKTQAANNLARNWNKPKLTFTCGPDTDEIATIGTMLPNTRATAIESIEDYCVRVGIPTFEDVEMDFEGSFEKLFGTAPTMANGIGDCNKEIARRYSEYASSNSNSFAFVKSPIIQALENGWVVEIQEPTVIKRSSVLVSLNAMLDCDINAACITLPTGEVIHRHPEAIVIFTTNADYDGCKALQQSVLSRIDLIREVNTPPTEELAKRVISNLGCKDTKAVSRMAKIVANIADYCESKDINDGVCGTRELQNWVKKAMILQKRETGSYDKLSDENICAAAFSTIIPHVSQTPEDREDVITGVLNKEFSGTTINFARNLYEMGAA